MSNFYNEHYVDYMQYRKKLYAPIDSIWTDDHEDYQRLPGNKSLLEALIYIGYVFDTWLDAIGYKGEKPLYMPSYSDIIITQDGGGGENKDSPHKKIPWSIVYSIQKKIIGSKKPPFGKEKLWKGRHTGFHEDKNGKIYEVKVKDWESIIEFTIIANSGTEAELYTENFEKFMYSSGAKFQEGGIMNVLPYGRSDDGKSQLQMQKLHYRKTLWYIPTQEFILYENINKITSTSIEDTEVN